MQVLPLILTRVVHIDCDSVDRKKRLNAPLVEHRGKALLETAWVSNVEPLEDIYRGFSFTGGTIKAILMQ